MRDMKKKYSIVVGWHQSHNWIMIALRLHKMDRIIYKTFYIVVLDKEMNDW
jgi:hypothetical protein